MKIYPVDEIRNVGIIGHGGDGKTSLGEAMLFCAGATSRLGKVDNQSSHLDFEEEEIHRSISLSSALHHLEWKKNKVTIVDTPGYGNFIFDTKCCLRVLDGAILTISAVDGVKAQSERVWSLLP